ncbi:hypothetical protein EVAR_61004_1 [Eumeta japonica]|uniref:Uncharacterized protein n=1 Tax=Eumeta variegata TaxID=151549 RepID=A0A4C1ZDX5_EUMVA|nr:hypothetical protein EVAR_61004_1 [Eumeta japonica]
MIWLVVARKPDLSTPSNMIELGDGHHNVNTVSRCCEARPRSVPKKKYIDMVSVTGRGGHLSSPMVSGARAGGDRPREQCCACALLRAAVSLR